MRPAARFLRVAGALLGAGANLLPGPAAGQEAGNSGRTPLDPALVRRIDTWIERERRKARIPGVALAITHGDRTVHLQGFGSAGPGGRPVTPHTPFMIGSVTKSITALAVMQLVDKGKIRLDAPVQRYLPWFRVADEGAAARITVRHLLHQTSGFSQETGLAFASSDERHPDAMERQVRAYRTARLIAPPGARYEYSNANYAMLGTLVQVVSGQPLEDYFRERVFQPLQMQDSFTSPEEAERHGMATGHRFWFGFPVPAPRMPFNRGGLGHGFLMGSAADLGHHLIAQLNDGRLGGRSVVSRAAVEAMHRPPGDTREPSRYAMGWVVRSLAGTPVLWHGGDQANYHAELALVPEGSWGIALLMNANTQVGRERLESLLPGVVHLLRGRRPPRVPLDWTARAYYGAAFLGLLSQMVGILGSLRARRKPGGPDGEPHRSPVTRPGEVLLPLALHFGATAALLWGIPVACRTPLALMAQIQPDLTLLLAGNAVLAALWGVVRAVAGVRAYRPG